MPDGGGAGWIQSFAVPYIDDILIFSSGGREHIEHVRVVYKRLRKANLTVKPEKCLWAQSALVYLGHTVCEEKITVPAIKVADMQLYKQPMTKAQLKSFLS